MNVQGWIWFNDECLKNECLKDGWFNDKYLKNECIKD